MGLVITLRETNIYGIIYIVLLLWELLRRETNILEIKLEVYLIYNKCVIICEVSCSKKCCGHIISFNK